MPASPLPAKLTRPAGSGLIRRERLFRLLDEAARHKVTWPAAPGGAGKTSAVSAWIETRRLEHLWVQVDARDADLATFFHYLRLLAARDARPGHEPLPVYAPAHGAELEAFAHRFFEAFFARRDEATVLVFDGWQEAGAGARIDEVLPALLAELPPHVRVVMASRSPPPAALARWLASPEFALVDADALRFSSDETSTLAASWGVDDAPSLAALERIGRGWAAGLVLLLRAARGGVALAGAADAATGTAEGAGTAGTTSIVGNASDASDASHADLPAEAAFNYFASEGFARLPAPQREFLLRVAFIAHLDAEAAAELAGEPRAARVLAEMQRDNLFVERRALAPPVYDFHPLFREFLVAQAERTFGTDETRALRLRAASWLERCGDIGAAAQLLIEARDNSRVAKFIERYADDLMGRAQFQTLRGWIDALPAAQQAAAPRVQLWRGICQARAREPGGLQTVRDACAHLDAAGDYAGACVARLWRMRLSTSREELEQCLAELAQLDAQHAASATPAQEAKIVGNGGRYRFDPRLSARHPLLARWIDRAGELASVHPEAATRLRMANFVCSALSMCGNYVRMTEVVAEHRHLLDEPAIGPGERLNLLIALAHLHERQGRWDESLAAAARAGALAEASGFSGHEAALHMSTLRVKLALGELPAARREAERLGRLASSSAMGRIHALTGRLHLAVHDGECATAEAALAELRTLVGPEAGQRPQLDLHEAMLQLQRGDAAGAVEPLREVVELAQAWRHDIVLLSAWPLLALALARSGQREAAIEPLREGLRYAQRHGLRCAPLLPRALVSEMCLLALRLRAEPAAARALIANQRLERPAGDHGDDWPAAVHVRTLGGFALDVAGENAAAGSVASANAGGGTAGQNAASQNATSQSTAGARKQPRRVFELLQFVVAHRGAVPAVAAMDALWPDAEGDAAKKSFDVTLHRLRKRLGSDHALRLEAARLTLDRTSCRVDAFTFERLAERAREPSIADAEFAELAEHALALYGGHFLADTEHSWARRYREALRAQFMRLAELAAARLEAGGHAGEARRWAARRAELMGPR
jgi:ATP/maltotriose-dependent transcriptional regulator MalT